MTQPEQNSRSLRPAALTSVRPVHTVAGYAALPTEPRTGARPPTRPAETVVDAEYDSAPDGDARASGERPSRPQRDEQDAPREQGNGLVLVAPPCGAPGMPPWLRAHAPVHHEKPAPELVMLGPSESIAAQQFRTLRYRIEQDHQAQVIAVVGPRGGEGVSVTAANLALALAEGGRVRVLLVDAALARPAQAKLFGIQDTPGLTSAIDGRYRDPESMVDVIALSDSLHVLPAGPRVPSAHAALASEAAAHLLGGLRRVFRYILVDASPVFGPAETLAWHGMIDRYVLVARRGVTSTEDLGKAANRLERDKVLGVTMVGALPSQLGR